MKLTKKQLEGVLLEHDQVNADVELMQLLRTQLLQRASRKEASDKVNDALESYKAARATFEAALNEELSRDKEFKECSERAYIQAARAIDRSFYASKSFEAYATDCNHAPFFTLSGLESSLLQVVNEHHKASEENSKRKKDRQSLQARIAEARAKLLALEEEAKGNK